MGAPAYDIDGQRRPQGKGYDMGADQYQVGATVSIIAKDLEASESGADTGSFQVSRTGSVTLPLVVNYQISGTAKSGSDYAALVGKVTIPAGRAATVITVTSKNDAEVEGDETVTLTLSSGAGYDLGFPNTATVLIHDNDH